MHFKYNFHYTYQILCCYFVWKVIVGKDFTTAKVFHCKALNGPLEWVTWVWASYDDVAVSTYCDMKMYPYWSRDLWKTISEEKRHPLILYVFLCIWEDSQERMCLIGSQEAYMFHGSMFWFPLFAGEYLLQIEILFFSWWLDLIDSIRPLKKKL